MIINAETRAPIVAIQKYGDDYIEHLKNLSSKLMAEKMLDILAREPSIAIVKQDLISTRDFRLDEAIYRASLEWKPLVKCKECKHRSGMNAYRIDFSDNICPYKNWNCPPDDFFCANGEREEKTNE